MSLASLISFPSSAFLRSSARALSSLPESLRSRPSLSLLSRETGSRESFIVSRRSLGPELGGGLLVGADA